MRERLWEEERVEEKIEVVEEENEGGRMRTKVVSHYITVSRSQLVPRDTLFNYGLRGATPMEGNSVHPLLLRGVHDDARNPSPIVRMESWKDKKYPSECFFSFFSQRFQADHAGVPCAEWPRGFGTGVEDESAQVGRS